MFPHYLNHLVSSSLRSRPDTCSTAPLLHWPGRHKPQRQTLVLPVMRRGEEIVDKYQVSLSRWYLYCITPSLRLARSGPLRLWWIQLAPPGSSVTRQLRVSAHGRNHSPVQSSPVQPEKYQPTTSQNYSVQSTSVQVLGAFRGTISISFISIVYPGNTQGFAQNRSHWW